MTDFRPASNGDDKADPPAPPPAHFDGRRRALAAVLVRNFVLTVLTAGIYRFWAKTRLRRYFWRHVKLLEDPLEYLGTARELLIGFLVVITVLAPLFGSFYLLEFFVGDLFGIAGLLLEAFYYLALFFLIQIAIYRMRRYRLTRTAWRGVRFGLGGSSFKYVLIAGGYGLATLASLGLAYPWLRVATVRYVANHGRFGVARMILEADASWLFRRWLAVVAPVAVAITAFVWINGWTFGPLASDLTRFFSLEAQEGKYDLAYNYYWNNIQFWPLMLVLASPIVLIWYRAVEFRHFVDGTRIDGAEFGSRLRTSYAFKAYSIFLIILLGASFLPGVAITIIFWIVALPERNFEWEVFMIVFVTFFVLVNLLFYKFIKTLFLDFALLKHACGTLELSNRNALDDVVQSSADLPGRGEGLVDALDVGGF